MEKIENFAKALDYLTTFEIICTIEHHNVSYFYLKDDKVIVNTNNAHYSITLDEFKNLFHKESFFLYLPNSEGINTLKDEEYYAWKAKGTN